MHQTETFKCRAGTLSVTLDGEPGLLDLGPFIGDVGIYIPGPPVLVQRLLFRWVMRPLGILLGRRRKMLAAAQEAYGPSFTW